MWWICEICNFIIRIKFKIRKIVPIITCNPWNPVAIKKEDPKIESENVKVAWLYSIPWSIIKYILKIIV
jgi:hypothetical protein